MTASKAIGLILAAGLLPAVLPGLGFTATVLLALMVMLMLGAGRLVCGLLKVGDDPFLALVTGYVLFAHLLLVGDMATPGAHPVIALAFVPIALAGYLAAEPRKLGSEGWVAGVACCMTALWCANLLPRFTAFQTSGRFDFWIDFFVHAGNLAQLSEPATIGRGMTLLADFPAPLYHYASLLPVALLARLAGLPPLDAVVLAWVPLGMLVMFAGVAALALRLAGMAGALLALAGLAILPAPEKLTLANGFFGFSWLMEASPGLPYSIGVGCAAFAALHAALAERRLGPLLLAGGLAAGCILIRVNTFVWLAPALGLTALAAWPGLARPWRVRLVAAAILVSVVALVALSWGALAADLRRFLFLYPSSAFTLHAPTRIDGLFEALQPIIGRVGIGLLGLLLLPLAQLGPWLLVLAWLTLMARRQNVIRAVDAAPWLLILVMLIAALLAPEPRNGDMSEFRHRGGPLVVSVVVVWCAALLHRMRGTLLAWMPPHRTVQTAVFGMLGALATLAVSVGPAKKPRMRWGGEYFGHVMPLELHTLARAIIRSAGARPRIAVANLPPQARVHDTAATLVALTGYPAYVATYDYLRTLGGPRGAEAARRRTVLEQLAAAPDLPALRALMHEERITHYVATALTDATFDPDRRLAAAHAGPFALYTLDDPNP